MVFIFMFKRERKETKHVFTLKKYCLFRDIGNDLKVCCCWLFQSPWEKQTLPHPLDDEWYRRCALGDERKTLFVLFVVIHFLFVVVKLQHTQRRRRRKKIDATDYTHHRRCRTPKVLKWWAWKKGETEFSITTRVCVWWLMTFWLLQKRRGRLSQQQHSTRLIDFEWKRTAAAIQQWWGHDQNTYNKKERRKRGAGVNTVPTVPAASTSLMD